MTNKDDNAAKLQAIGASAYAAILEMVEALEAAQAADDSDAEDVARETIESDPLSVEVRDGWKLPGTESDGPEEFRILLSTGGPATRIVGELNEHGEPCGNIQLQSSQDWFQPWTAWRVERGENEAFDDYEKRYMRAEEVILTYCRQFYFGGC